MTKRTILFDGGPMEARYPDGITVHADTAYECISALRFWPGFQEGEAMQTFEAPQFGCQAALTERLTDDIVILVPSDEGSGGKAGSWLAIAIGVVLIVFAPVIATTLSAALGATITATQVGMVGLMLVMQGISGLFMKQPKANNSASGEGEKSAYLPANGNTVRLGTRIPLILGRHKAFGHFVSWNVTATDFGEEYKEPPPFQGTPGGVGGGLTAIGEDFVVKETTYGE